MNHLVKQRNWRIDNITPRQTMASMAAGQTRSAPTLTATADAWIYRLGLGRGRSWRTNVFYQLCHHKFVSQSLEKEVNKHPACGTIGDKSHTNREAQNGLQRCGMEKMQPPQARVHSNHPHQANPSNQNMRPSVDKHLVPVEHHNVLKKVIKQERPSNAAKGDHGMPSSHAQSLGYLSVYTAVALVTHSIFSPWSNLIALGALALGLFMTWLRVVSGYHTYPQVTVGFSLGSLVAVAWEHVGAQYVVGKAAGMQLAVMYGLTGVAALAFVAKSLLGAKHDVERLQKVLE